MQRKTPKRYKKKYVKKKHVLHLLLIFSVDFLQLVWSLNDPDSEWDASYSAPVKADMDCDNNSRHLAAA